MKNSVKKVKKLSALITELENDYNILLFFENEPCIALTLYNKIEKERIFI